MTDWIGAILLLCGAALCLLAAAGVLRLPDFFMRMHAATKAGVVGCGLVLLGVGFAHGTAATWIKIAAAIFFLILTTPVAGHLLGRAAFVGGAPFRRGTTDPGLDAVLPRGRFDAAAGDCRPVSHVLLALARGERADAAIDAAIALARLHGASLCGLAIIDVPRLQNVGPIPIGAGWHAQSMRERRLREARRTAAHVIQRFEDKARTSGLDWSVRLEEGRPHRILESVATPGTLIGLTAGAWFDQGVLDLKVDVRRRLQRWGGSRLALVELGR